MAINKNRSYEKYILPSKYSELESFSKQFKIDMMKHVLDSIEIAIDQDLPIIEVFQFKNSNFVITLGKNDYISNLDNIFDYFMKNELYENCGKISKLQSILKNDEKEKS